MTEQPNLTKMVLDHVIERNAKDDTANLRELAEELDVGETRLAKRESKLYPAVNCGVSPMYPWPWEAEAALEWYDKWDAEPPEGFDSVDWVDR